MKSENFQLSSLSTKLTGLDLIVWVKAGMPSNESPTQPSIYIEQNGGLQAIPIFEIGAQESKDDLRIWIHRNNTALLKLWHGTITTDEFISQLVMSRPEKS